MATGAGEPRVKTARKRREGRKDGGQEVKRGAREAWYVAMHEVNIAICLASGFLSPRPEENAALDQHARAGCLILESGQASAKAIAAARGGLAYGSVAVAEVELTAEQARGERLVALPLGQVKRLLFSSEDERSEFLARTSAYGDIPDDLLPVEVAPSAFGAADLIDGAADLNGAQGEPSRGELREVEDLDRRAGALMAAIVTAATVDAGALIGELSGFGEGLGRSSSLGDLAVYFAGKIDRSSDGAIYEELLRQIVSLVSSETPDSGFSAAAVLRTLAERLHDGAKVSPKINQFLDFARDVVAMRRDVPPHAFEDSPGSTIPRAILLFLLNPQADQLRAIAVRTPRLGPRVYALAAFLIGARAGLTRLPKELKASRVQFLSLAAFVYSLAHGTVGPLIVDQDWQDDGGMRARLMSGELLLAESRTPPAREVSEMISVLSGSGINVKFSKVEHRFVSEPILAGIGTALGFELAKRPVFPRTTACLASLSLVTASKASAKAKTKTSNAVARMNSAAASTGVYARLRDGVSIELLAFVQIPLAREALETAVQSLTDTAKHLLAEFEAESASTAEKGQ